MALAGRIAATKRMWPPQLGHSRTSSSRPFDGGTANLYQYAVENPASFIDPTGEFVCGGACLLGTLAGAINALLFAFLIDEQEPRQTPTKSSRQHHAYHRPALHGLGWGFWDRLPDVRSDESSCCLDDAYGKR